VSRTRLVLVITHRHSTAAAADQILFLENGQIIEHGSPADLLSRPDGTYRHYFDLQTRGWTGSEQKDNKVEAAAS
jgi:ATP-binding cassette subfamily B protein